MQPLLGILRRLLRVGVLGVLGALMAGGYGVLHDQVTYSIGPEYYTRFKCIQFQWADCGWPLRCFVGQIGFLATWWVGAIAGLVLAFCAVNAWPREEDGGVLPGRAFFRSPACRYSLQAFGVVFGMALLGALVGFVWGDGMFSAAELARWEAFCAALRVEDTRAFLRVGAIHNLGYLGGAAGLLCALLFLAWKKVR